MAIPVSRVELDLGFEKSSVESMKKKFFYIETNVKRDQVVDKARLAVDSCVSSTLEA